MQNIENPEKEISRIIELFNNKGEKSIVVLFTAMLDTLHDAFANSKFTKSSDMIRAFSIDNVRLGFAIIADALSVFQTSITDIDESKITAMHEMLGFITELQTTIEPDSAIFTNNALGKALSGKSDLSGIGRQIKSFGLCAIFAAVNMAVCGIFFMLIFVIKQDIQAEAIIMASTLLLRAISVHIIEYRNNRKKN